MNKLPKLICKNVWKLYGDRPKEFLHQHNNSPDQGSCITIRNSRTLAFLCWNIYNCMSEYV